ncbi:hydrolase, partial [candidate division KSB1 bacterium]
MRNISKYLILLSYFLILHFLSAVYSQVRLSQPEYEVKFRFNVRIPMSDGTELSADMYMPDAKGKFPAILIRTPYNNNNSRDRELGPYFARRGYVYITQDVRGRGDSDGIFYPLVNEAKDGYDTYEWIGRQEWSNGKVGSLGGSYLGWTQVYAATMKSKYYTAMIPQVTPPDPFLNFPVQNGVLLLPALEWVVLIDGRSMQDLSLINWMNIYTHLPVIELDQMAGRNSTFWKDWNIHYFWDDYWDKQSYQKKLWKIDIPAIHISGWYDDDLIGTIMNFTAMFNHAKSTGKEKHQKMIIGPWPHAFNRSRKLGDFDYGPDALIDMNQLYLKWFDYWLKGKNTGILDEAPVKIFVMGDNVWRNEKEWPLKRTVYTKYYFHSKGKANSLYGDGKLSTVPPIDEPPDRYTYDPAFPVPFIYNPAVFQLGTNEDQRPIEKRDDVLCYTSDILKKDLEITGPITVKLYASSSAKDTDFFARLVDVFPNGYAMRVNDGMVRARFRNSFRRPSLLIPGKIYEFTIDLWATSLVFKKGHRIRVEISSSAFPKFARNLNTGEKPACDREMIIAEQTIYHNREYP